MGVATLIYYVFYHSLIKYGIVARSEVYKGNNALKQKIHKNILNFMIKNSFLEAISPLNIKQVLTLEVLFYYYEGLKEIYKKYNSKNGIERTYSIEQKQRKILVIKLVNSSNKTLNSLPNE